MRQSLAKTFFSSVRPKQLDLPGRWKVKDCSEISFLCAWGNKSNIYRNKKVSMYG